MRLSRIYFLDFRAEGEAHGEFAAALEGAGDEEAEAVEAGDGEDEEDGALEEEELAGEGAEEIFAGYLYFHKCPNPEEMQAELKDKIRLATSSIQTCSHIQLCDR